MVPRNKATDDRLPRIPSIFRVMFCVDVMWQNQRAAGPDYLRNGVRDVPYLLRVLRDLVDIHPLRDVRLLRLVPDGHEDLLGGIPPARSGCVRAAGLEVEQRTPSGITRG